MSKVMLTEELKRKFVIERLLEQGITKSQDGVNIHDLDYDTLKYELVLAAYREIDIQAAANRWF